MLAEEFRVAADPWRRLCSLRGRKAVRVFRSRGVHLKGAITFMETCRGLMRAVIISEIDGQFKKIVWIEEGATGVYVGFYGKSNGMHCSYHDDGNVHIKQGQGRYRPMYKTTPIKDIKNITSIHNYGIQLEKGYEFAMDDFRDSKDAASIIYVNARVIKREKILNISTYFVPKGMEKDCIVMLQQQYQKLPRQSFEILNAYFFKLDKYKGLLGGVFLIGGK